MDKDIERLLLLTRDYLFYNRIGNPIKDEIDDEIVSIINKYMNETSIHEFIMSFNTLNVGSEKLQLNAVLRILFLKQKSLSDETIIKLYFENEGLDYLNELVRRIETEKVISFVNNNYGIEKINKLFKIYSFDTFKLINLDLIEGASLDLYSYVGYIVKEEDYNTLVNNYKKLTPKTVSYLLNRLNNDGLLRSELNELVPYAQDSSLNFESNNLSKVNENIFIEKIDINEYIELIKNRNITNLENGIKINLLKSYITSDTTSLSDEDVSYLINSIDDSSLELVNWTKYEVNKVNKVISNEFLNKFTEMGIMSILYSKIVSDETKLEIINYIIQNDLIKEETLFSKIKVILSRGAKKEVLYDLLNTKEFFISKLNLSSEYFTKEEALEILSNKEYYEQLNASTLLNLLNALDKKNLLKIIDDKSILMCLNSNDLAYILNLDFEGIIESESLIEYYNKDLLLSELDYYFDRTEDLSILLKPAVSKLLFGSEEFLTKNDIESITYLIDYQSNFVNEDDRLNTEAIKAFTGMYLLLGVRNSLDLINLNDINITPVDILQIKDKILQAKMNEFRITYSSYLNGGYDKLMYALELMMDTSELYDEPDEIIQLFFKYADESMNANKLFESYIINNNNHNKEETEKIKKEIRDLFFDVRNKVIAIKTKEFNEELLLNISSVFKIKNSVLEEMTKKYQKESNIKSVVDEFLFLTNSKHPIDIAKKKNILGLIEKNIDIDGICDFEEFKSEVLRRVLIKDFDKEKFLNRIGYKIPKNYDRYVYNKKLVEEVTRTNNLFDKYANKEEIFKYILGETDLIEVEDISLKLIKEQRHALSRYKDNVKLSNGKISYNYIKTYDDLECADYENVNEKIDKSIRKVFKIFTENIAFKDKNISLNDLFEYSKGKLHINNENYEVKKRPLDISEIKLLFGNYDFKNSELLFESSVKEFIKNNIFNIRFLGNTEDEHYIKNFGYMLSHFEKLESICKTFKININNLTIEDVKVLQDYILLDLTPIGEEIDKRIISDIINNTTFIDVRSSSKRVENASNLMEECQKRVSGTIPLIKTDKYEILDYHNNEILISGMNNESCFRVSGQGNDFITYCAINKNGGVIFLKDPNTSELLGRVSMIRRGNAVFMHQLQITDKFEHDDSVMIHCEESLKELSDRLIEETKNSKEPIEFVTITKFKEPKGALKDSKEVSVLECDYIANPINTNSKDFQKYLEYPNLEKSPIYKSFYHNYGACETLIISSSKNANEFKDYDAEEEYLRNRSKLHIIRTGLNEKEIKKINKIMYLSFRKENDIKDSTRFVKSFDIENIDAVYLGEDWVIIIDKNKEFKLYNGSYDARSEAEINKALNMFEIEKENTLNVSR